MNNEPEDFSKAAKRIIDNLKYNKIIPERLIQRAIIACQVSDEIDALVDLIMAQGAYLKKHPRYTIGDPINYDDIKI